MKEIYNFIEYGSPKINSFSILLACLFTFFFIVGVIRIIAIIISKHSKLTFRSCFPSIATTLIFAVFFVGIITFSHNNNDLYEKCVDCSNQNQYLTEIGKIDNLTYLKRDNETEYRIDFELNNVVFDFTSFAYNDARFSYDDILLLDNSKEVTVNYIEYDNTNIILSISVK